MPSNMVKIFDSPQNVVNACACFRCSMASSSSISPDLYRQVSEMCKFVHTKKKVRDGTHPSPRPMNGNHVESVRKGKVREISCLAKSFKSGKMGEKGQIFHFHIVVVFY
jgi:hypothetical protein